MPYIYISNEDDSPLKSPTLSMIAQINLIEEINSTWQAVVPCMSICYIVIVIY